MKARAVVWCLTLMVPGLASAQATDGATSAVDGFRFTGAASVDSQHVAWRREIRKTNSRFMRVYFEGIRGASTDYKILIRDYDGNTVKEYSKAEFEAQPAFWSAVIPGDAARVEVVGLPAAPADLSFEITQRAFSVQQAVMQSITGPRDLEDIREVDDPAIQMLGKPVAKISFLMDDASRNCTGFMVTDELLLTNEHCINSDALCATASVIFGYERDEQGLEVIGEQQHCLGLVASDAKLDFALLKVAGSPGRAEKWGTLPLCGREPKLPEDVLLIQHPAGEPKQVSQTGCFVESSPTRGSPAPEGQPAYPAEFRPDFTHLCDTKDGSSGSPVLDAQNQVVGLHHLGFTYDDFYAVNRAVRMGEVLPEIAGHVSPRCVAPVAQPPAATETAEAG